MIRRPLFAVCIFIIVVQIIRIFFFGVENMDSSALEKKISDGQYVSLSGTVYRIETKTKSTAFYLKDNAVSAAGSDFRESAILVYDFQEEQKIKIGNRVKISGTAQPFDTARNPGNFDQRKFYQRQGIHVFVRADSTEILSYSTDRMRQGLSEFRQKWIALLKIHLGEYYGGAVSAVLLGDKSGLDENMRTAYQKCGISHLLAISGLHMTFLGMGMYRIFRKIGFGFAVSGTAGMILLLIYSLMISAGVSGQRALIMFIIRIGAEVTGRDYDFLTGLGISAAALCSWNPLYLTDAGFLLSYGSVLGIAVIDPVLSDTVGPERKTKTDTERKGTSTARKYGFIVLNFVLASVRVSAAVNIMLMGPMLYFYYEMPLYSVLLNIIVIPALPAVMTAGLAGSALVCMWEPAGRTVLSVCKAVLAGYDFLCECFSGLPMSRFVTGRPSEQWLIIYYLVLSVLCVLYSYMKRNNLHGSCRLPGIIMLLFSIVMLVFCRAGYIQDGDVRITMLDVGQGDCIHIRACNTNILVDGGSSDISQSGKYRIEPYLLSRAADTLDYVFITHGDQDHISGIEEMLANQRYGVKIRNLVLPAQKFHDDAMRNLAFMAVRYHTRVLTVKPGGRIKAGDMVMMCLAPDPDREFDSGNEASLVLEVSYGKFRMLLTGDIGENGEQGLMNGGKLCRSDVLKASHHGSGSSSSGEFLEVVAPRIVLISAGRKNRYGHPHQETLDRFKDIGSRVYQTLENGAVMISTDGYKIRVHCMLE